MLPGVPEISEAYMQRPAFETAPTIIVNKQLGYRPRAGRRATA
jgi:hypothetical protein